MSAYPDPETLNLEERPPAYRAMVLSASGDVLANGPVEATNDADALAIVKAMAVSYAVELWDGLRFIEHVQPRAVLSATQEPFRRCRTRRGSS